jgi:tRNA/tmRNA/rRNA uracil-C5-methylase (TrmA/RlmC/RlmD family)
MSVPQNAPFPTGAFCTLPYEKELHIKTQAVQEWWQINHMPGRVDPLTASPKPRNYRNTSKRRVINKNNRIIFISVDDNRNSALLEAESHETLYRFLLEELNRPVNIMFGKSLNYIIIRGSHDTPSVIFNIDQFNAPVIRRAKAIAQKMLELSVRVLSAFLYLDPSRSDYYLESRQPDKLSFKKLYGPEKLYLKTEHMTYSYAPTCFSQINEYMVPHLLTRARELLSPLTGHRLIDLYCGYGLFSHYLARECAHVIGIEKNRTAIRSAIENKEHLNPDVRMNFIAQDIGADSIEAIWGGAESSPEVVLLDPPYQGTAPGVILALCNKSPERILHIFCSMDALLREAEYYFKNNYTLERVVPLDLFPGTQNLEMLLLFKLH